MIKCRLFDIGDYMRCPLLPCRWKLCVTDIMYKLVVACLQIAEPVCCDFQSYVLFAAFECADI